MDPLPNTNDVEVALLNVPALFTVPPMVVTPFCALYILVKVPLALALMFKVPAMLAVTPDVLANAKVKASVERDAKLKEQVAATLISSPVPFMPPTVSTVLFAADCRVTDVPLPLMTNRPMVWVGTLVTVAEGLLVNCRMSVVILEERAGLQLDATWKSEDVDPVQV